MQEKTGITTHSFGKINGNRKQNEKRKKDFNRFFSQQVKDHLIFKVSNFDLFFEL